MSDMITYPAFETARLQLRELTLEDADEVLRHFSDPSVTEFMDIEACKNIEEAVEIISFHLKDAGTRWGIFLQGDPRVVGTCGYHCLNLQGAEPKAEIGFDLSKPFWGNGYMQEALIPVIDFAFQQMKLSFIEATVEQNNHRSLRLLEKLNFTKSEQLKDNLYYYVLRHTV